jgi:hypothetical protein
MYVQGNQFWKVYLLMFVHMLAMSGVAPDRVVYNSMIHLFGKARLYKEAVSG